MQASADAIEKTTVKCYKSRLPPPARLWTGITLLDPMPDVSKRRWTTSQITSVPGPPRRTRPPSLARGTRTLTVSYAFERRKDAKSRSQLLTTLDHPQSRPKLSTVHTGLVRASAPTGRGDIVVLALPAFHAYDLDASVSTIRYFR